MRTNHIKARIDKTKQNSKFRLCGDRDETINHITSECRKLAQKEYKARHDWVGKVIHWEMCKKLKFDHANKWYIHNQAPVLQNDTHKLLWYTNGSPNLGQKARPYNNQQQKKKICKIVDFAVPAVQRIKLKECEKRDKYLDLARELKKLWNMKVTIIPIVIGAFGKVTKGLLKDLEDLEDLVTEWRPSRQQHYWKRPEYWEKSWRLEETCCHSNSSERPSDVADMKNSNYNDNNNSRKEERGIGSIEDSVN